MYEDVDFAYIDRRLNEVACEAHTNGFDIIHTETRDDWASPGDFITIVYMRRSDLDLYHQHAIRSNGKLVSNNDGPSMRAKVRTRYRQLVYKMERRLNKTTADSYGDT